LNGSRVFRKERGSFKRNYQRHEWSANRGWANCLQQTKGLSADRKKVRNGKKLNAVKKKYLPSSPRSVRNLYKEGCIRNESKEWAGKERKKYKGKMQRQFLAQQKGRRQNKDH